MSNRVDLIVNISPYFPIDKALDWVEHLKGQTDLEHLSLYLALPYDLLRALGSAERPSFLLLGGHKLNTIKPGTFITPVATQLWTECGAKFVLLGTHCVRQRGDEEIPDKIKRALADDLMPLLCIGETVEEYEQGQSAEILERQLGEAISGLDAADLSHLQIVYEASWIEAAFSRPSIEEIEKAYHLCREIVHKQLKDVKVYCPIPSDLSEVNALIQTIHADGFYLCHLHQVAALDATAWQSRVATSHEVEERAEALLAAVEEAEPSFSSEEAPVVAALQEEPQEAIAEMPVASLQEEEPIEEKSVASLPEEEPIEEKPIASLPEEEPIEEKPVASLPEEEPIEETPIASLQEEEPIEETPVASLQEEEPIEEKSVASLPDEEPIEGQPAADHQEGSMEPQEAPEASPVEEAPPPEKTPKKRRSVKVSHMTPTVEEVRKKRKSSKSTE